VSAKSLPLNRLPPIFNRLPPIFNRLPQTLNRLPQISRKFKPPAVKFSCYAPNHDNVCKKSDTNKK
jgi:hypothetical protein